MRVVCLSYQPPQRWDLGLLCSVLAPQIAWRIVHTHYVFTELTSEGMTASSLPSHTGSAAYRLAEPQTRGTFHRGIWHVPGLSQASVNANVNRLSPSLFPCHSSETTSHLFLRGEAHLFESGLSIREPAQRPRWVFLWEPS